MGKSSIMNIKVNAPQTATISNWEVYMARKRAEALARFKTERVSDIFDYAGRLDWRDGDNASH